MIVVNLPPVVAAAPNAIAVAGEPRELPLATFTDPGRLDSHVATVSWGDGATGPATIVEDDGSGTVSGWHAWASPGAYAVSVCVVDDDGGEGCDTLEVQVLATPPALRAEKTYSAIDRDGDGQVGPGDDLLYRIEIFNDGVADATGVTLSDPIPVHTRVVPGSASPALLVTSEDPLVAEIPSIGPGSSIVVQFAVTIDTPLAEGIAEILNSGVVESVELPPILTDDPTLPGFADPTRTPVVASAALAIAKIAELIDVDGDGVATPGDEIGWRLTLAVAGNRAAGGVVLTDPLPEHTTLVAGSIATSHGEVVGLDPLIVSIGALEVGATVQVTFRTLIDPGLPAEVETLANQASVASNEIDALLSDDPSTAAPADPTAIPVYVHPTLTIAGVSVPEGDSGVTPIAFPLTLDRPARLAVSVAWVVEGLTAVAGEDFVAASGTLTIPVGSATGEIVAQALGDLVVENDELLRVVLSSPTYAVLGDTEAIATLVNDDATALSVSDASAEEGEVATFTLQLSAPSALPVTVGAATLDGDAIAGVDYTPASGAILFAPMETARTITVATLEDLLDEPAESFFLELSGATGATIADGSGTGTIVDDDLVELAIEDAAVVEGDAGDVELVFRLFLSAPTYDAVEVDGATVAESATEGADFAAVSGRLALPAGEIETWVVVPVHGDLLDESDETLRLVLSNAAGATLVVAEATGTIIDDDETSGECLGPNLLENGDAEAERQGCEIPGWTERAGDWSVQRLPADPLPVDGVAYFLGRAGDDEHDDGGGEDVGDDLWPASGGSGHGCHGGDDDDDDGTATPITLDGGHGGGDDGCHDDDDDSWSASGEHGGDEECISELAQTVNVGAFAARIDTGEQRFDFSGAIRTELEAPSSRLRIAVEYLAGDGSTPLEAFDSGWLWSDGAWQSVEDARTAPSGTRRIRVRLFVDGQGDEARGYFDALELRPVDTTVLAARDLFELEGQSGTHDALVPLDILCPSDFAIELDYLTVDGSARAPGDYLAREGTIALPPSATATTVPVPIVGDTVDEPNERFELRFSPGELGEAVLFDAASAVTIGNDDFCRRSPGYWKNHRSKWAVDRMVLGEVEYDDDAMMDFLRYGGPDGSTRLARHLVATKLNLARGSHPWIQPTVAAADLFLIEHPPGSAPGGAALAEANGLKDQLDSYNNSGCQVP